MNPTTTTSALLAVLILAACSESTPAGPGELPPADSGGYLMAHFAGEHLPTGEQIYFAFSTDGLTWKDLNGSRPVLISEIGELGVRDPSVIRSPNGDRYWILATDLRMADGRGWGEAANNGSTSIVIWESDDLVTWSEPWLGDVAGGIPNAGCAWAPEAIYDPVTGGYVVYWATISPRDGFTKARIYYAHTEDFRRFTPPQEYINRPGDRGIIDTQIIPIRDADAPYAYVRASADGQITFEGADSILGPWTFLGDISHTGLTNAEVEGPFLFRFNGGERYGLYVDQHGSGGGYLPLTTIHPWSPRTFQLAPSWEYDLGGSLKRHGSILNLSPEELVRVRAAWGGG
jgi:hypothetical protein